MKLFRTYLLLGLSSFVLYSTGVAQNDVQINVVDQRGIAASGVTVYVADGYACFHGVTDIRGALQFKVAGQELLILASDLTGRNRFGPISYAPQYSSNSYTIRIPHYPQSSNQAGRQLDNFIDVIAKYHEFHSLFNLNENSIGQLNSLIHGTLGVSGVFSVSPIPRRNNDGRLVLRVSGELVEPIMRISNLIPGHQFTYSNQVY